MIALFSFLHFLGMSFLVGGEPLVAMIAIRSEKNDNALRFFVDFLWNIVIFMWIGMILTLIGGLGMVLNGVNAGGGLFVVKALLYVLVAIVSFLLFLNVSKVKAAATVDFRGLRSNLFFKRMDMLSKIDMVLILAIVVVSVLIK